MKVSSIIKKVLLFFSLSLLSITVMASFDENIELGAGEAKTIKVSTKIETVFLSTPSIANYKVISDTSVVIYGVDVGSTSILIYDLHGKEIYNNIIIVNQDLRQLKKMIAMQFPNEDIKITNIGEQIVINGLVSSEDIKQKAYNLVGSMLKKASDDGFYVITSEASSEDDKLFYTSKHNFDGVINNLKVLTTNQINVKITIAEVSNSFLTNLGVTYGSLGYDAGTFVNQLLDFSAKDIVAVIAANANDDVGQILAEPNLTVFSGEQASFLVGGEIPIAVREQDGISISYKEYGIRLSMVAKVLEDNNIRMTLSPEVSSLDETNRTSTGLISIPALRTRKALTTVQLKDGESFILAGLLSSEEAESLSKIPYLSDIPILGAFFSNTTSARSKTELIIVATVNLVNPVMPEDIKLPQFNQTGDIQRLLRLDSSKNSDPELNHILKNGGFN